MVLPSNTATAAPADHKNQEDLNTTKTRPSYPKDSHANSRNGPDGPNQGFDSTNQDLNSPDEGPCIHTKGPDQVARLDVPDGGWGWVVVASGFFIVSIFMLVGISFGVIFREPLTTMGASSTTVAGIFNIHAFMWHTSIVFMGPLCKEFSLRSVGLVCVALASAAMMLLAFATTPLHILLLFGVVIGTAGSVAGNIVFLVVPTYFDKHRGTAMAIVMTGISVGQFYVPVLVRFLQDQYGFKGATLIFGAIMANGAVAVMFFHPVEKHQRKKYLQRIQKDYSQVEENINNAEYLLANTRISSTEMKDQKSHSIGDSMKRIPVVMLRILQSTLSNLKAIRHLRVLILTISFSFLLVGYMNFIAQLPFAMQDLGHSAHEASWCLSVSAIGNTIVRVVVSVISDRKWFNRKLCFISGSLIAGFSSFFVVFAIGDVKWIMMGMIFWGIGIGANLSVYHALAIDTCGTQLYVPAVTVSGFNLAIATITTGPFIGVIRDLSSYSWSLGTTAAMELCCALLWLLMPCAVKRDAARTKQAEEARGASDVIDARDREEAVAMTA